MPPTNAPGAGPVGDADAVANDETVAPSNLLSTMTVRPPGWISSPHGQGTPLTNDAAGRCDRRRGTRGSSPRRQPHAPTSAPVSPPCEHSGHSPELYPNIRRRNQLSASGLYEGQGTTPRRRETPTLDHRVQPQTLWTGNPELEGRPETFPAVRRSGSPHWLVLD